MRQLSSQPAMYIYIDLTAASKLLCYLLSNQRYPGGGGIILLALGHIVRGLILISLEISDKVAGLLPYLLTYLS